MKNAFTLICAALLSVISFVSCDFTAEDFIAPQDTWVNKDFQYKYNDSTGVEKTVTLTGYFLYSDDEYTNSELVNVDGGKLNSGLTVVITSDDADKVAFGLLDDTYIIKNFGKSNAEYEDLDGTTNNVSFGSAAWNAFYIANSISFANNGKKAPRELTNSKYKEVSADGLEKLKKNFSWRKLLANILLAE